MSTIVRLGAVNYLNARPLVHGLADPFTIRFDPPAVCATLLASGEIDLGLVPTIAYLDRPGDAIVPGVSIGSEGPVASVAIFTRRPMREVRTLALDTSSRTSVALTRILCLRQFEIGPVFVPHAPDLASMLVACDAALVIGDAALFADYRALGAEKIDLGQAWTHLTGLPFVWAFWSGRRDAASPDTVRRLQTARDQGVAVSDSIADAYVSSGPLQQATARHYLREHITFGLTDRMLDGLRAYYAEAVRAGVVPRTVDPTFYPG